MDTKIDNILKIKKKYGNETTSYESETVLFFLYLSFKYKKLFKFNLMKII